MPKSVLTDRWRELLGPNADSALDELIAAYSGRGRHYHGLEHIDALLTLSAEHGGDLEDRDAVDLAIFYHDAIYDPKRSDNEARSAELARVRLTGLGIAAARADRIARWIAATKHVSGGPTGEGDLDHLLDFDLSVLAAEPAVYVAYGRAIRKEYAIYPDVLYRPGRAKVLEAFLTMSSIYRVPALAALWEARARANLQAELASLT